MKISDRMLYKSKFSIIFVTLLFFKPGILNYVSSLGLIDFAYSVLLLVCCTMIIFFRVLKKDPYSMVFYFAIFALTILIPTYINGQSIGQVAYTFFTLLCLCIYIEQGMKYNPKKFLKYMYMTLFLLLLINLVLMIAYPNGLYMTEYYHNKFFFLSAKNGFIGIVLPTMVLGLINYHVFKSIKMANLITISVISIVTMVYSKSSTGISVLVFLFLQVIFINRKSAFLKRFKYVFWALIIISLSVALFRIQNIFGSFIEEIFGKSVDLSGRVDIWDIAINMIKQKPLMGYGANLTTGQILIKQTYYYSHNLILEIIVSGGIIALFALGNLFYQVIKKIRKNVVLHSGLWFVLMGIICFLVVSITEAPLTTKGLYMLLVLADSDFFYSTTSVKNEIAEEKAYECI